MHLTHQQAQAVMLAAMGLLNPPKKKAKKLDVLEMIRQMSVLQIDTIHVVARSPYLVLWSRLGDYNPDWLDDLLAEKRLFEYWAHAACFIPAEQYPLFRRLMLNRFTWHENRWRPWFEDHAELIDMLLTKIREDGPVRSADFERTDGAKSGWWNWKDEKTALEGLWTRGDLMIAKRHNFQRVYDLRENILPDWDDARAPAIEEVHCEFVLKSVRSLGITTEDWIADYYRMKKQDTRKIMQRLLNEEQLRIVHVEGWDKPAYVHPEHANLLEVAAAGNLKPTYTTLLSPFDPLVWDRARALAMFNFDYRIECYTPAPKRRYGYFTLPILHRGAIIGRLDPKAHRKEGVFEIKALHLEPGVVVDAQLIHDLTDTLKACAEWHNTPRVVVREATEPGLAERLSD